MPKFLKVRKGDETRTITEGQWAKLKAAGWERVGKERVRDEFGQEQTVTGQEAEQAFEAGRATEYVSQAELTRRAGEQYREEQYGDDGMLATGLGGISSIPLAGAPLARIAGEFAADDAGMAEQVMAEHPGKTLAGQAIGTLAQVGLPIGPGAAITKGATRAGKAVEAATKSRTAGLAVEGALDSAAWTVAQNHANAVIKDDPVTVEMLAADLPLAIGLGAGIGGAVGGLSKLSTRVDAKRAAKKAAEGGDFKAWQAADDKLAKEALDAEEAFQNAGYDLTDATALAKEEGRRVRETKAALAEHRAKKAAVEKAAKKPTEARQDLDEVNNLLAGDLATDIKRNADNIFEGTELKLSGTGQAKKLSTQDWKDLQMNEGFLTWLGAKVGKPNAQLTKSDFTTWVGGLATQVRKKGRAVEKMFASGKYLDGSVDDLNAALVANREFNLAKRELADAVKWAGHRQPAPQFSTSKLKGIAENNEALASARVWEAGPEGPVLTQYGQGLKDMGVVVDDATDAASSTMVRAWGANQDIKKLQSALDTAPEVETALLAQFDEAEAFQKAAIAGHANVTAEKAAAKRALEEAKRAQKRFRLENKKPAVQKQPEPPTGLVAQLSDATLGRMGRAIRYGQDKISGSVDSFIKVAGKPRRGTVPAASAILGKMRFDDDLGVKPKNRKEEMKRVAKGLNDLMANPDKVKQRVHNALRGTAMLKPGTADALLDKAMQRITFLHGLVPQSPNMSPLAIDRWQPSETEIDKFTRIAAAAEDPYSILDDLNAGRLTQEAVDTVKQLYPEIYHSIQMEVVNRTDEIKANVNYKGRLQLGILFQAPTDEVLEPSFVQIMQENYALRAQEQEQAGGGQMSTPGAAQKSIQSTQTASQRIESK